MRFTTAWANVASQNVVLRITLLVIVTCLIVMSFVAAKLALKNPIVVERACFSSVLESKPTAPNPSEVEAFVKAAVSQRFNSDETPNSEMLSIEEFKMRSKEQEEMNRRQIKQRVIVNNMSRKDNTVTVDTDRIISIGNVRSAFSFPLIVTISTEKRTIVNPYGLVATKIAQPSEPKQDGK